MRMAWVVLSVMCLMALVFCPVSRGQSAPASLSDSQISGLVEEVFEEMGMPSLKKSAQVKFDGVSFTAQGYDSDLKIGYVVIKANANQGWRGDGTQITADLTPEEALQLEIMKARGEAYFLIIEASNYFQQNMNAGWGGMPAENTEVNFRSKKEMEEEVRFLARSFVEFLRDKKLVELGAGKEKNKSDDSQPGEKEVGDSGESGDAPQEPVAEPAAIKVKKAKR